MGISKQLQGLRRTSQAGKQEPRHSRGIAILPERREAARNRELSITKPLLSSFQRNEKVCGKTNARKLHAVTNVENMARKSSQRQKASWP